MLKINNLINVNASIILGLIFFNQAIAKDIKIGGELMLDHDTFDAGLMENSTDSQSISEIRRASLSVKSQLNDDWQGKFKVDFSDDSTEIKDAYLKYKGFDWANITLGKQKEAFGLERLLSSKNTLMIERSLLTNALTPGRSLGISLDGGASNYHWQIGYFQPEEEQSKSAITGRLTWLPWRQQDNLIHLGAAFSERDLNGIEYRINEHLEVHSSDSLFEGDKLFANDSSSQGLEVLWLFSGITAMAEWQKSNVTDIYNIDHEYQGGYLQVSYQLSGQNRKYKNGKLGGVTASGWEIATRVSQLEMLEEDNKANIYSIGVNYTLDKNIKFMANYLKSEQINSTPEKVDSNAISLRVQYSF